MRLRFQNLRFPVVATTLSVIKCWRGRGLVRRHVIRIMMALRTRRIAVTVFDIFACRGALRCLNLHWRRKVAES